ncbi:MAG: carbohydrate-binding domain-containing protein [Clostridia bacterium]|nr:carbohydrate-binding domain-containing protein [Clostridia bacterium]
MQYRKVKKNLTLFLVLSMLLASCTSGKADETERIIVRSDGTTITETTDTGELSDETTDFYPAVDLSDFDKQTENADAVGITLSGTTASCASDDVTIEDGRITVTGEGSYRFSGDYTGQIVVQAGADDNVQLILDGVNITGDMAPIYIANCKNASITLASGTVNSVTDSADYTFAEGEDEPDAAIFSDCDLTINGDGTLNVTGNYACGIRTKDDLRIVSGNLNVNSVGDAVKGRDSVQIAGGNFVITSDADGLKSNNDEDSERGYIVIDGGSFVISAGDDGVHAESWLVVNGGNLTVTESYEGLEAMKVELNGGNIDVTAADDALNAASPSTGDSEADDWFGQWQDQRQNGGRGSKGGKDGGFSMESSAEVIPAGTTLSTDRTLITIAETEENVPAMPGGMGGGFGGFGGMTPPDGMEFPDGGTMPEMPDGMEFPDDMTMPDGMTPPDVPAETGENTDETVPTQGFNRGDRNNGGFGGGNMGGFGGGMGGETPEEGVWIRITGGNIRLTGGVDVLDSNGTIEMTGGTVIVDNPRMQIYGNPDGIFDANGTVTLSGGTYAAFAQSTGNVTQITKNPSITVSARMTAGDAVEVKDASGDVIFSGKAQSGGNVFFLTSDALMSGEDYTVTVGTDTSTVTAK